MEGDLLHNALQLAPSLFDGNTNEVHQLAKDDPNQQYIMVSGADGIYHVPLPFPLQNHSKQTAHSYVEFLAGEGVSEIQQELSYNISGLGSGFRAVNYSLDIDAQKTNDFEQVKNPRPHGERTKDVGFASIEHQLLVQKQEPKEDYYHVSQPQLRETVAAPSLPTKRRRNASRQRTADQRRRMRIAQSLDALQELLPDSKEGCKASLLDDIIHYVKYLQLQIKDLSQSRLRGESTSDPFIFLEGYGHYLVHDQMPIQPLEEMMGKLLEVNPLAATQLLQSRGLVTMPLTSAAELSQVI